MAFIHLAAGKMTNMGRDLAKMKKGKRSTGPI